MASKIPFFCSSEDALKKIYASYLKDPNSVEESWIHLFSVLQKGMNGKCDFELLKKFFQMKRVYKERAYMLAHIYKNSETTVK